MTDQQIIVPKPQEAPVKAPWNQEIHEELAFRWNPPYQIPNIQFHYDHDDWFNRNLSMHAARDWKNHPFWFFIAMLFFGGQLAWTGMGIFIKFAWFYHATF